MIDSGKEWLVASDSVIVFSHSVSDPQTSDSLKAEAQKSDSVTMPVADTPKIQKADNQPQETPVNKKHKVLRGERLNTIALREYGHKAFWVYIYDENRSAIQNPDLIEPGMVIDIPPAEKYGIDKNNQVALQKALELEQKYKQ